MRWLESRPFALGGMVFCLLVAALLRLPALTDLPPGIHYDEAANAILAAEIGLEGSRPIFITSYTGKEVLFFYLAGGLMRLIGPGVFPLRLTAAFIGLLTVAATYRLGRELLPERRRAIALLAAALLATSFWHLLFSRLGFRAISQPLLQALAAAALFRGLRRRRWDWSLAGGVALGLTAYTYLAVRLYPLLLGVALLPSLLERERPRPSARRLIAAAAGVALLVAGPLLLFFARHPDAFWVRIGQVAPGEAASADLLQAYARAAGMLFVAGDPYWRFNLPGRPLFIWPVGALLLLGWLLFVPAAVRARDSRQRGAALLLLAAPLIMLLPTALAVGEILPSNLRAIGLIPFVFYLPAAGLVAIVEWLARWRNWPRLPGRLYDLTLLLILAGGGLAAYQAYFQEWGRRADVFYDSEADLTAVAAYLDSLPTGDGPVYLAAPHYRHPTIALLSQRYSDVKWLWDGRALVAPPSGPAHYVFPHSSPAPDWAAVYLAGAARITGPNGPDGAPLYVAYRQATPLAPGILQPVTAHFDPALTFLGHAFGDGRAGATVPLTLFWRVNGPAAASLSPFVHLEDQWGHRWSQVEPDAYPAEQWSAGELVIQRVAVPVPAGAPPGIYRLRVGWFDTGTLSQLPRLDGNGRYAGSSVSIDNVPVAAGRPPDPLPRPRFPLGTGVTPELTLLGYDRGPATATAGEPLSLAFWWLATAPLPDLISRIELVRSNNVAIDLATGQPVHDTYPFAVWDTPQLVIDRRTPFLPADLAPGDYRLRLRLLTTAGSLFTADLGGLAVTKAERLFIPPATQRPLAATFGREIALVGYDLAVAGDDQFRLTLVWQALTRPSDDYTVFVHVLQPDGRCDPCAWQQDVMPRQGSYPTSRWLSGEVVVDEYLVTLPADRPAGNYQLEIGLYLAENGQRLLVERAGQPAGDAVVDQPPQLQQP